MDKQTKLQIRKKDIFNSIERFRYKVIYHTKEIEACENVIKSLEKDFFDIKEELKQEAKK